MNKKSKVDYSVAQKVIHWSIVLLIVANLIMAENFSEIMHEGLTLREFHISVGFMIGALAIAGMFLRAWDGSPPPPKGMPEWQGWAAVIAHKALYTLIGLVVVAGLLTVTNSVFPLALFGLFDITIGPETDVTFKFLREVHEFAILSLLAVIVIHMAAALHHHFVAKDDSTIRMLRFWRSGR